jgi:hypothetical protein
LDPTFVPDGGFRSLETHLFLVVGFGGANSIDFTASRDRRSKYWINRLVRVQGAPTRPLLSSKPVVVIVSVGDGSLLPGGTLAHLKFLEPHLETILAFIGLTDITLPRNSERLVV